MSGERRTVESWQRMLGFAASSLIALAAVIALRGPDWIGPGLAESTGAWRLTGNALWHPLAPFGALGGFPFTLWGLGMRGWQNAHVIVIWLTVLCWLWPLPARNWSGLLPVVPALLAVALGDPQSGWSPFGVAFLLLSMWRAYALKDPSRSWATFAVAAWVAVWFSPAIIPVAAALVLELSARWSVRRTIAAAVFGGIAAILTPWGMDVWARAWMFLAWDPQPLPDPTGMVALVASLLVLAATAWMNRHAGVRGPVWGAALLFLAATRGQTAYLWPAALMMIPCWILAQEKVRSTGFNIRWWMRLALVVAAALLLVIPATKAVPRWYDLAMSPAMVRPTLTRDALPKDGLVYINPGGRAVARFSGKLSWRIQDGGGDRRLAREPSLWRAHDRQTRHTGVWLLGDRSEFEPLARHLGRSPDWRLAAVDATGMMFVRAPRQDEFATETAQQFADEQGAASNRGNFLAASSLACLAADALPEADELARLGVRNARESTRAAAARAVVLAATGDIREALRESERATRMNPRSAAAWQARAETLLGAGSADDALAAARRAVRFEPGNEGNLWLAARAANAARDYGSEADFLERLVALTLGRGGDAGFYQLYLGESYARQGLARPALRAYRESAKAPGLSAAQQEEIAERIREVEAQTGR